MLSRLLLTFFLIGLFGCTPSSNVGRTPVIKVNNHVLTTKEFAESLAHSLRKLDALTAKDPHHVRRAKDEIVRRFIVRSLILDSTSELKIKVTEDDVLEEVNSFRALYPEDISFRRMLAEEELSLITWKERIKFTLIEKKFFQHLASKTSSPSEEEVKRFYEQNKQRFQKKERVLLRQIVIDDLAKANEIKAELKKRDFNTLATRFSIAPESKNGGFIGWIEKGTVDIFDKTFALQVGTVSQVLESSYGFHIFKVEKKKPAGLALLEEVKSEILKEIQIQKEQAVFLSWLDAQLRKSRVLKNNEIIDKMIVETRS